MPVRHAIWKVAAEPLPLDESSLVKEQLLEEMIVANPKIVSDEWMLIGRQEYTHGSDQLLSRTWLIDPTLTQINAAAAPAGANEPWNGEFYSSFGDSDTRSWEDAREFGFICGGGGAWYSKTLQLLGPNDRI